MQLFKSEIFHCCLGCIVIDIGLSDFVQYGCDPGGVGTVCVRARACAMLLMFQRHKLHLSSG